MANRLEKLQQLEVKLLLALDEADEKTLPSIARQYRETIREIEEIEGIADPDDEVENILSRRESDGESRAIRKSRA